MDDICIERVVDAQDSLHISVNRSIIYSIVASLALAASVVYPFN
jgi:hypothetical protein